MNYMPLYRVKGDAVSCCNPSCNLTLDFRAGHFYLYYILEDENKVGCIFQHRKVTTNQVSLSISQLPKLTMGATNIPLNLVINFMTCDDVEVLRNNHCELVIEPDESINRKLRIWLRKKRGFYTKPKQEEIKIKGFDDRRGSGIYCINCMENVHNNQYRNAQAQFQGYAEFYKISLPKKGETN